MLEEWYLEAVEEDPDVSVCVVFSDTRTYTIGRRRRDQHIICSNALVSRNHGIISLGTDNRLYIKDLKSANGTYVNDLKIAPDEDHLLAENDLIGIGAPSTVLIPTKKELFRVRCKKLLANSDNVTPVIDANSFTNNNINENRNFKLENIIKSESEEDDDVIEENTNKNEKNINNICNENLSQKRIQDVSNINEKNVSVENKNIGNTSLSNVDKILSDIVTISGNNTDKIHKNETVKFESNDKSITDENFVNNQTSSSGCHIVICSSDEESNDNLSNNTFSAQSSKKTIHKNDLLKEKENNGNTKNDENICSKNLIVKTEPINYSFSQNEENNIIASSDDEDIFPKSQLFNDVVVKTEPNAEQGIVSNNENCGLSSISDDNDCDNIFSSIKKEIPDNYISIDDDTSDDDCNIWLGKLSQSQDFLSVQGRSKNNLLDPTNASDKLLDILKFDDKELQLPDENVELAKEEEIKDIVLSPERCDDEEQLKINDKVQEVDDTDANIIPEKHVLTTTEDTSHKSFSVLKTQKDKTLKNIVEIKKPFVKPPVIEAHFFQKGKRKVNENLKSKECTTKSKKRKSSNEEVSSISTSVLSTKLQVDKSVRQELDKRHKRRRKSTELITKNEKQKIQENRKKKLKELATKSVESKDAKLPKNNTKPKVKLSNSRGSFLTDINTCYEPVEKKKKNEISHKEEELAKITKFKIPKKLDFALNKPSTSKIDVSHDPKEVNVTTGSTNNLAKNIVHAEENISAIKGILRININSKKKSEKHVTFTDTPQIKYFQRYIENNSKQENRDEVRFQNEILTSILEWVPMWLDEQRRFNTSPPITKRKPLRMCTNFNSIGDYFEIVTPLMLLELWKSVFKDWISNRPPSMLACVDSITKEELNLNDNLYLNCHRVMYNNDQSVYPCRGDLLALEVKLNSPKGKILVNRFAYVVDVFRRRLSPTDVINRNLITRRDIPPDYKLTFTLMTRNFIKRDHVTMTDDRLIRIGLVSRIVPPLRVFKSLSYLEKSSLRDFILKPTIQQYKFTRKSQFTFATKNNLNNEQRMCVYEAYEICTRNEPGIYMIEGPPGTGKSYVIKHLVQQLLHDANKDPNSPKCRILLCAPSNAAVDEIANTLLELRGKMNKNERIKMVRLGPPGSIVHPLVKTISLSEFVSKHLQGQKHNHIKSNTYMTEEYNFLIEKINTLKNTIPSLKDRNLDTSLEEQKLKKVTEALDRFKSNTTIELSYQEKKKLERETEIMYLENAEIVCSTLSSCVGSRIEELFSEKKLEFTCCIVDEATQSCEQENLIPLMLGIDKFVLVGDPNQLPPTTISQEAKDLDYGQSLFSRIKKCLEHFPDNPIRMLCEQYRMHPEICQFPNDQFYGKRLKTSEVLINRTENILNPYCLFCLNSNIDLTEGEYLNKTEANLVLLLADIVLRKTKYNIGIITPYIIQKKYLLSQYKLMRDKEMMENREKKERDTCHRLVINTVDSFQGQERDVIIISSVRYKSNIFLSDLQRFNVALTRAKHAVFICSHANLFKSESIWQKLEMDAKKRNFFYSLSDKQATDEIYLTKLICKH